MSAPPQPRDEPAVIPPPGEDLTIEKNWPCQPERETDEHFMLRMRLYRPWSLQPDDIVPNWPQIAMGMSATTFAAMRMQANQPPQSRPPEVQVQQVTPAEQPQQKQPQPQQEKPAPQPQPAPEQRQQEQRGERREERHERQQERRK